MMSMTNNNNEPNPMKKHIPFAKNRPVSNGGVPVFNADIQTQPKIKHTSSDTSIESNEVDVLNVRDIFPKSYRIYRLGLPAPQELKYF